MDLFFVYTSRLCQVVACAAGVLSRGVADSPLLPAINLLLQWIATNPGSLRYQAWNNLFAGSLCQFESQVVMKQVG